MRANQQSPVHANLFVARRALSGMTLLELLIVMAIMLMVTAAAIPMLITGAEGRKQREASRLVSSYISGARSRAINSGRPFGVMIERFNTGTVASPNYTDYAMSLSYVEVPTPYAGEYSNSMAMLVIGSGTNHTAIQVGMLGASATLKDQDSWTFAPRVGDLIKFNYQGRLYRLMAPDTTTYPIGSNLPNLDPTATPNPICWNLYAVDNSGALPPAGTFSYQIIRQPVKAAVAPLQLPKGIVIDLACYNPTASIAHLGAGSSSGSGIFYTDISASPLAYPNPMIVFYPGGAVQYVYDGNGQPAPPTAPIHLLLGRIEGMWETNPLPMPDASNQTLDLSGFKGKKDLPNILSPNSQWVSIGYQTGLISTTENGAQALAAPTIDQLLLYARAIAHTSQSMGGR